MRADDQRIGVIVLAAGASTRLGQPKQLLTLQGETLLRRAANTALAFDGPIVVLGANADRLRRELDGLPVTIVVNDEWREGMASSLRAGVRALSAATPPLTTAIVMLCDQPHVTQETLRALAETHRTGGQPAVVCRYTPGALGPPCLFDRSLFPDLLALRGPQGAKQILSRLPATLIGTIPFPEGKWDIDTPEDWERFATRNPLAE